jgi:hypothetical protein
VADAGAVNGRRTIVFSVSDAKARSPRHTGHAKNAPSSYRCSSESSRLRGPVGAETYATRWYSWSTPPRRSRRWTRIRSRSTTLSGRGRSRAAWLSARCGRWQCRSPRTRAAGSAGWR